MGRIIETTIDRFDGGISQDRRSKDPTKFAFASHFDTHTYLHKLVPYHTTEAAETKSFEITDFIYAPTTEALKFRLFGLGEIADASGKIKIYRYDVLAPGSSWAAASVGESTLKKANNTTGDEASKIVPVFFYYKNFIYTWAENKLVRFDNAGESTAFENDVIANVFTPNTPTSFTDVAQPVHHRADDNAYFFSDNLVHKLDNTTWSPSTLVLPDNLRITSACEFGNYLAIACVSKGKFSAVADSQSVVFLWDRDSSLTTISERIDFGRGAIRFLANLDNKLIAVMDYYTSVDLLNIGLNRGRIIIKQASGGSAVILNSLELSGTATIAEQVPFIRDNILYFSASSLPFHGETKRGIVSVDSLGRVTFELVADGEPSSYSGIYAVGNQWWMAHSGDGSVDRLDDGRVFSTDATNPVSIYESLINGGDIRLDPRRTKKLVGITVNTDFLPAVGVVNLYYRTDEAIEAGAWTQIFTNTANNSISQGAINADTDGDGTPDAELPEYKMIQFKIESLGGAVISGLSFKSEFIDKEIY